MKKIIVPCDFSEPATNAFRFAINLAKQSKGEISLLHVLELPILYDTTLMPSLSFEEEALKDMKEYAERKFGEMKSKWAKDGPKVKWQIKYGPIFPSIQSFAKVEKADLIVMGTKGASGLKEIVIGSNTEKIVRTSPIPVIAIKELPKNEIKNIVFPNTLDEEQEALATKIKALQNFFKAKLHIVFVNTPFNFRSDQETRQLLNGFVKRYMFKDVTVNIYNDKDEQSGLVHFTEEVKGDMIAMRTHGRRGLAHLLSGSTTEDVVNHIKCPIWTYKIK